MYPQKVIKRIKGVLLISSDLTFNESAFLSFSIPYIGKMWAFIIRFSSQQRDKYIKQSSNRLLFCERPALKLVE